MNLPQYSYEKNNIFLIQHTQNIYFSFTENLAAHLPWMTETRIPAERIISISARVILCVQQALTWPSKPLLDCIPVADIPFTYSCSTQVKCQARDILFWSLWTIGQGWFAIKRQSFQELTDPDSQVQLYVWSQYFNGDVCKQVQQWVKESHWDATYKL